MKALVHVTLKSGVLDPQGKAIQRASLSLGYAEVTAVRQGKLFQVELDTDEESRARKLLEELCQKLLANPVIEDFEIVLGTGLNFSTSAAPGSDRDARKLKS